MIDKSYLTHPIELAILTGNRWEVWDRFRTHDDALLCARQWYGPGTIFAIGDYARNDFIYQFTFQEEDHEDDMDHAPDTHQRNRTTNKAGVANHE